jgi:hypothetical protein
MKLTTHGVSIRVAAGEEFVDPASVQTVDQPEPGAITFIAPYHNSNPPFYDVGFLTPSGHPQRRRLNHAELRLMFKQGFKVVKSVMSSLEEFFGGEKRLINKQKLRVLTHMHPLSPQHPTTPIPHVNALGPDQQPPPDPFANPITSARQRVKGTIIKKVRK